MAKTLIEAYEEMKEGIGYDELIQTLNYYHIEIQRKRIRCPFPGHNDRHIGNCSITDRGMIYCFACGKPHCDAFAFLENGKWYWSLDESDVKVPIIAWQQTGEAYEE